MEAIDLKRKLFKKAIMGVIDDKQYNANLPRSSFIKTIIKFKKVGGAVFLRQSLVKKNYLKWEILFLEILDELGIEVKSGVLGKPKTMVTSEMIKGAHEADLRHHGILGNDY